jgi:hypothetical protein
LHRLSAAFVLGYHGCDRAIGESLLSGASFAPSQNDYDWLGPGIYFWEANPLRGLEFAKEVKGRRGIKDPFVVGAVIDCGFCLDLLSSTGVDAVATAYDNYRPTSEAAGTPMPENSLGSDLLKRKLDCAVIKHLHGLRIAAKLDSYDTVRGAFREGPPSTKTQASIEIHMFRSVCSIPTASRESLEFRLSISSRFSNRI